MSAEGEISRASTAAVLLTPFHSRDAAKLKPYRLDAPPMARLAEQLRAQGMPLKEGILTVDEMAEEVARLCK